MPHGVAPRLILVTCCLLLGCSQPLRHMRQADQLHAAAIAAGPAARACRTAALAEIRAGRAAVEERTPVSRAAEASAYGAMIDACKGVTLP